MNEALSAAWGHFVDEHADEHVRVLAADMFASGARAVLDRLDRDGRTPSTTSRPSSTRG